MGREISFFSIFIDICFGTLHKQGRKRPEISLKIKVELLESKRESKKFHKKHDKKCGQKSDTLPK